MREEFSVAAPGDEAQVSALVRETISAVYPLYYPRAVVDFFLAHHGIERIREDIARGRVRLLKLDGALVGTGSVHGNEIARVFVAPGAQGKGCGKRIMDALEDEIAVHCAEAVLDSSLPACGMYERRGYRCVRHEKLPVEGGAVLVYEVMKKPLARVEMTDAGDARFQELCRALDEHLAEATGRTLQKSVYDRHNSTAALFAAALVTLGGEAVGCGGLKAYDGETAELKRMFVAPGHRGHRLGERIVRALEAEARARGYRRLILETGKSLVPAQRLYLRLGFHIMENYGPYRGLEQSVCMEKEL